MLLLPEALQEHREALREGLEEGRIPDAPDASFRLSAGGVGDALSEAPTAQAVSFLTTITDIRQVSIYLGLRTVLLTRILG